MKKPTTDFTFAPAAFIPFRDQKAIDRVRRIKREDIAKHPNPDFRITVMPDAELEFRWITDMFFRIQAAMDAGRPYVMIMPNPWPGYAKLARLLNGARVDCRTLHTFNMDEYADEQGRIAPESWEFGFGHAFKKYFWSQLDTKLRPAERQIHCLSDRNVHDYGRQLADLGGADICYSGPGWTGHLAFIEPDAPEFAGTLEEWKQMGPRVCTLSPFTIAQNSLHGCFGMSGDLCAVPPKAATIGPAEVIGAKHRIDMHGITVDGSFASWQRLTTRLVLHGPVTPRVPESILQTLRTDVWVTESLAANIETRWDKGY
jgi:6-phosphogluconolactonase/glucosamine-6-phosphate isomerase/deaminase